MGIADPAFSRSSIYVRALRAEGVEVLECFDTSRGLRKFIQLYKKHRALRGRYGVLIVGYPSYIAVPFARLISRKPIIFDAGWSLYEGMVVSRGERNPLKRLSIRCIDWLAYRSAALILLESESQVKYYTALVHGTAKKCRRLFTGTDETQFSLTPAVPKHETFTVLFRGRANTESGIECAIEAARLLQNENIRFLVVSLNYQPKSALPATVEFVRHLDTADLRTRMLACHVSLGQLSAHERLERTIPHKAYESMALKLPYVTARNRGIQELFTDGKDCLMFTPGSAEDLAEKIRELRRNPELAASLAENAYETYQERCSNKVLANELIGHIRSVTAHSE